MKRDNDDQTQYLNTFHGVKVVLEYDHDGRGGGREEDENDVDSELERIIQEVSVCSVHN